MMAHPCESFRKVWKRKAKPTSWAHYKILSKFPFRYLFLSHLLAHILAHHIYTKLAQHNTILRTPDRSVHN